MSSLMPSYCVTKTSNIWNFPFTTIKHTHQKKASARWINVRLNNILGFFFSDYDIHLREIVFEMMNTRPIYMFGAFSSSCNTNLTESNCEMKLCQVKDIIFFHDLTFTSNVICKIDQCPAKNGQTPPKYEPVFESMTSLFSTMWKMFFFAIKIWRY